MTDKPEIALVTDEDERPRRPQTTTAPEQRYLAIREALKKVYVDLADVRASTMIGEEEIEPVEGSSRHVLTAIELLDKVIRGRRG